MAISPCITPIRHWLTVIHDFVASGELLDLAIALVIGNAFTKVVESFVDHLFTPTLGFLFDGIDIADLKTTLNQTDGHTKLRLIYRTANSYKT